ncbi:MAG: alpha/beta fold hydrolase, partial [Pseudobdellovibrionaceae bacterium]
MSFIIVLLLNLFLSSSSSAEEVNCTQKEICTIYIQVTSDDQRNQQKMPYQFKYRAPKGNAPTLIFMPGGPGDSSTNKDLNNFANVPKEFGLILTDPRFVGINEIQNPENFKKSMRTELVAKDVVQVINSIKPKSYVLYGSSYGTMVATIVASKMNSNPPRALILESTIGKATTHSSIEFDYNEQWKSFIKKTDPNTYSIFKKKVQQMIRSEQFTSNDFGTAIMTLLQSRRNALGVDDLEYFIELIADGPSDIAKRVFQSLLKPKTTGSGAKIFGSVVQCNEILPDAHLETPDLSFDGKNDILMPSGKSDCFKYKSIENQKYFDSKDYQIKAPIFYIQGENDPTTPKSQTEYHFKNQKSTSTKFIINASN